MEALVVGYFVLPFVVAFVLVFVHWDYHPGNGDLAGIFEVMVPTVVLFAINAAAGKLHFLAAVALAALEVAFIVTVCVHAHNQAKQETEMQQRVELRKRETFASRVDLAPDDPIIDGAYAHLTEEARKSIQNRGQLAALLGEHAEEKQKELRRKRLFKE